MSENKTTSSAELEVINDASFIDIFETDFLKELNSARNKEEVYLNYINSSWNKCIEGILQVGFLLNEAKETLYKKGYKPQYKKIVNECPFTEHTVNILIKIYKEPNIRNNRGVLPPSWGTLDALTKLPDDQFTKAVEEGYINPEMIRSDVQKIKNGTITKDEGDKTKPERPYKDYHQSLVIYLDEVNAGTLESVKEALAGVNDNIKIDESPFEARKNAAVSKAKRDGRAAAIDEIKAHFDKVMEGKGKTDSDLYTTYPEYKAFKSIKKLTLLSDPIDPESKKNRIDEMLALIKSKKTCEDYEKEFLEGLKFDYESLTSNSDDESKVQAPTNN